MDPIAVTAVEVAAARAYRRMRGGHVHEAVAHLADATIVDDEKDKVDDEKDKKARELIDR